MMSVQEVLWLSSPEKLRDTKRTQMFILLLIYIEDTGVIRRPQKIYHRHKSLYGYPESTHDV